MIMYSALENEFSQPFESIGKDFKNEYTNALVSFNGFDMTVDEKYEAVKGVLQKILDDYSASKASTRGGRIGRFFARVVSFCLPFIKFK